MTTLEEQSLFHEAMADVQPITHKGHRHLDQSINRQPDKKTLEARRQAAALEDEQQLLRWLSTENIELIDPLTPLNFHLEGIQQGVMQKLRQGRYPPDAQLVLLRKRLDQVRRELSQFMQDSVQAGLRNLLIIHGKSKEKDVAGHTNVVRSMVAAWLQEYPEVLAYHQASERHGGRGALYILLRKSPEARLANREYFAKRRNR